MKVIKYPQRDAWPELIRRPAIDHRQLSVVVENILSDVQRDGDRALSTYTLKFDAIALDDFLVAESESRNADTSVSQELKDALDIAKANIEKFHVMDVTPRSVIETSPGVTC